MFWVWVADLRPSQQFFSHVGATASWVLPVLFGRYMYLAHGYNTVTRVRIESPTFHSRVRCSTTSTPRLPNTVCKSFNNQNNKLKTLKQNLKGQKVFSDFVGVLPPSEQTGHFKLVSYTIFGEPIGQFTSTRCFFVLSVNSDNSLFF